MNAETKEIEKESKYILNLYPDIDFPSTVTLEITNPYLRNSNTCESNIGTCSFVGQTIILHQPYPAGYTGNSVSQFEIIGLINPRYIYPYSDMKFSILARNSGTVIAISYNIPLQDNSGSTFYLPHNFQTGGTVVGGNYSTLGLTYYNFSFVNKDYALYEGYKLRIVLPNGFYFTEQKPSINIISGFPVVSNNNKYEKDGVIYVNIDFTGYYELPVDTNIQFQISDILNPYAANGNYIFKVLIYHTKGNFFEHSEYTQFEDQAEFSVDIDTISQFPVFEVSSSSTSICDISPYTFKFQLGHGNLSVGDYVHFTVPDSVTDCAETSISFRKFCSTTSYTSSTGDLPVERIKIDNQNFQFKNTYCHNLNGSEIEFQIDNLLKPRDHKANRRFYSSDSN